MGKDEDYSRYGSFAAKMLAKQGWSKGSGLGKELQGMSDCIKPTLKFDTTGMGHDAAKEFTNHWWDMAYNKSASKFEIIENEDGDVDVKKKEKISKKEKKAEQQKQKNSFYSQFVSSGTLENGKLKEHKTEKDSAGNSNDSDSDSSDDEGLKSKTPVLHMNDDELFQAMGGLTAHKGARHGHKMSAKQARIEEMERKLLAQMQGGAKEEKKPEKKAKKEKVSEPVEEKAVIVENVDGDSGESKKKKKKRKREKKDKEESSIVTEEAVAENVENEPQKKKKKKKRKAEIEESEKSEEVAVETVIEEEPSKKKKKKKKEKSQD